MVIIVLIIFIVQAAVAVHLLLKAKLHFVLQAAAVETDTHLMIQLHHMHVDKVVNTAGDPLSRQVNSHTVV